MSLLDDFPHTVALKRPTSIEDSMASSREGTPVTLKSNEAAWVQNTSRRQIEDFDKRDQQVSHNVFFTTDHDLRPGDFIEVTAGPSFVGLRLDFAAASDRSAGLGKLFCVFTNEDNNARFDSFV